MSDPTNPYSPPESAPTRIVYDRQAELSTVAIVTFALVLVACIAYIIFVIALLRSSGIDRKAGMMFCGNLPVFVAWIILVNKRNWLAPFGGVAAAVVQIAILLGMLMLHIGEWSVVVMINGLIAIGFFVLAFLCHQSVPRAVPVPRDD